MINLWPTSRRKKSRTNNINKPIINRLSNNTIFIYWLIAVEDILHEVRIPFFVFVCIGIELFAGTVGIIRVVRIRFLLALGSLKCLGK